MFSVLNIQAKQIFIGNMLFIACCAFYLAWWLLAFKPSGAVTGMKTGWLLLPAVVFGIIGVVIVMRGLSAKTQTAHLFNNVYVLWGSLAAYFILLAITVLLLKRPATTELLLIVAWGMLALLEINTMYGFGLFSHVRPIVFIVVICVAFVVSLVCYVLYYNLDMSAGYIDGMIPLLVSAITLAAISGFMLFPSK